MSYLIDIDPKGGFLLRPAVKAMCPEFSVLSDEELLVIVLIYDNFSIYRQHNERARIAYAITRIYGDNNPKLLEVLEEKTPHHRITNAVEAYKSLQYNPKVDLVKKYQQTIEDLQDGINADLSDRELDTKLKAIDRLRKSIHSLENEIAEELIAEGRVTGDKSLSYLEKLQANRKLYEAVTKRKKAV